MKPLLAGKVKPINSNAEPIKYPLKLVKLSKLKTIAWEIAKFDIWNWGYPLNWMVYVVMSANPK